MLFYTNKRESININKKAKELKYNINIEANKEIIYIDDDGELVLEDVDIDILVLNNDDENYTNYSEDSDDFWNIINNSIN